SIERRNPPPDELRHVSGAEETIDTAEAAGVMRSPRQPLTAGEHLTRARLIQELRDDELKESLHARRIAFAREHERLLRREREPLVRSLVRDVAGRGIAGEPLACVPLVDTRLLRNLLCRGWSKVGHCAIDACLVADVRQQNAQRSGYVADDFA